jgi:hypothetical protein
MYNSTTQCTCNLEVSFCWQYCGKYHASKELARVGNKHLTLVVDECEKVLHACDIYVELDPRENKSFFF